MTRTPLRPLARILSAREKGENPDAIERENLRLRHEADRDRMRHRAEGRLLALALFFFCAFSVVGVRMGLLAASEPSETQVASLGSDIVAQRANIVDRNGRILATNLSTHSLYAQTRDLVDPQRAAHELIQIFPDLDEARLMKDFTGKRKFLWIKKKLSPEQMQAVHDIGEPGLLFGPREMRLYPNGRIAAHVLGGASFGREGVHSAEVVGTAGVEKKFDAWLRDPANNGAPLQLSIDLTVQAATREVLEGGMRLMNAKGASAVLMDVHTGEILTMISLPDFDPNDRPRPLVKGDPGDSPLFNRAVQGVYELGSVFKIFTAAQAMDLGLVGPDTIIDANAPMRWGKFKIKEFHGKNYGKLSVTDVIVNSSNVGTAKMALAIGGERQKAFLGKLGFLEPTSLEMVEAPTGKPLLPPRWTEINTITISYGHGLSSSPVHLAAGYASLLNGGTRITPTLLRQPAPQGGERVVSERASTAARKMLRAVVSRGTASFGDVPGYSVAGKTGTADKPKPQGGYYDDKVIATFASVFPSDDPKYVLVVTLDEPVESSGPKPRRTAGWTAVPVAAEIIRRTAPLLGLHPEPEPGEEAVLMRASN
ncbi:peptidoglycan D,D-transpeptidase FtsI family protein [Tropicimonas isoalkanivorans]|uniref:Cell division protein FtsI (Penicillin-binding protein 3) n=1 Tax=Tropicimonas isoalkanivorans TaxID=441112 RepID=A0A1I1G5I3_9RHOB|nr:penicillin-binding protein 2 [Tropicimonas isoalkanivorans]SFC06864.1 cell division protein FtsI (penicillin-binding protein 3) [Tropicimonas isoalkanivorans]